MSWCSLSGSVAIFLLVEARIADSALSMEKEAWSRLWGVWLTGTQLGCDHQVKPVLAARPFE